MVDKSDCCARKDGKVQWTVDREKTIMIGIKG